MSRYAHPRYLLGNGGEERVRILTGSIRVEVRGIGSLGSVELPIKKLFGGSLVVFLDDDGDEGEGEMRSWAAVL